MAQIDNCRFAPYPPLLGSGEMIHAQGRTLESRRLGALPVLGRFIKRLRIEGFLSEHLLREDRRSRVPTATALLLLVRNLLILQRRVVRLLGMSTAYDR